MVRCNLRVLSLFVLQMFKHFDVLSERVREYKRFNAGGTQITVRLRPPTDTEPPQSITSPNIDPPRSPIPDDLSQEAIGNESPVLPEVDTEPPVSPESDTLADTDPPVPPPCDISDLPEPPASPEGDTPSCDKSDPPEPATNPVAHFLASVKKLFEYALKDVGD